MNENLITKWRKGLEKTRKVTFGRIANFLGTSEINDETWDELETLLIQSDIGAEISLDIVSRLQQAVHEKGLTQQVELADQLKEELFSRVDRPDIPILHTKPFIILLVGVNGSGKTTSAAKLAYRFTNQGKAVMLVAADTYRAAAIDQLKIWADRVQVPVIAGQQGGDPGASVFDGIKAAMARQCDVVIIDTAGRLHTRYNLMEEIKKVHRVCGKAFPGAPHATWLVLDATTGQNALQQAKSFQEAVKVDGIVLVKLDMSSKGGMAFAIKEKLGLPILFAGLGEGFEDLETFDPEAFINGIVN